MLSVNSNTLDSFSDLHASFDKYCSIFLFLSLESLFINIRPNMNFNLKVFNDELLKCISNIYHSSRAHTYLLISGQNKPNLEISILIAF